MKAEEWALVVSVIALVASIGIPVWQWLSGNAQQARSKRTLLLQRILDAKSTTFLAMHELIYLLQKHGAKMVSSQRKNLEALLPRMRKEHEEMETLHREWSNYDDGESLQRIEEELATINVIASEATDTAKLIENGRRSYENT